MRQCWRWFGENDPVTLDHVKQAGAVGIVSALHHIYDGSAWSRHEVDVQHDRIRAAGLTWDVVESIPVRNEIKIADGRRTAAVDSWKDSLRAVAETGVKAVCYNFMPVVDWTRTDLRYALPTTGLALRFDAVDFAAYDIFVLQRPDAAASYPAARVAEAETQLKELSDDRIALIERNLIAGLPASERQYDRASFKDALLDYATMTDDELRGNLASFLREVVPVAEELGVRLCIHPDDPPFSLFGMPRVVSTAADVRFILSVADTPANGLTFCTGSYGVRADNDLVAMIGEFGGRIHFTHLRNVTREPDGSFYEAEHLEGSTDMVAVIDALLAEEQKRKDAGRTDWMIPMRPDHGHLLADDIGKARINPGYSLIGRLKGLGELRGVMRATAAIKYPGLGLH
ncbi:mannonate dehydratase [Arvimicrobium flavum]|uniref:mannonate dehydratase n=1 Tax=Arvimicrobium flavum TaxID=3393320 RepID=UPI00237AA0B1|nr:mannonate dehydratase [Mesorhizobium shangrilense]